MASLVLLLKRCQIDFKSFKVVLAEFAKRLTILLNSFNGTSLKLISTLRLTLKLGAL